MKKNRIYLLLIIIFLIIILLAVFFILRNINKPNISHDNNTKYILGLDIQKLNDDNSYFIQRNDNISGIQNISIIFLLDDKNLNDSEYSFDPKNPDFGSKNSFSKLTVNHMKEDSSLEIGIIYKNITLLPHKINILTKEKQHLDFYTNL